MILTLILVMDARIVQLQVTLLVQDLHLFVPIFAETIDSIQLLANNVIMDLQVMVLMMDAQMIV